jgi:hypothetical protein
MGLISSSKALSFPLGGVEDRPSDSRASRSRLAAWRVTPRSIRKRSYVNLPSLGGLRDSAAIGTHLSADRRGKHGTKPSAGQLHTTRRIVLRQIVHQYSDRAVGAASLHWLSPLSVSFGSARTCPESHRAVAPAARPRTPCTLAVSPTAQRSLTCTLRPSSHPAPAVLAGTL